MKINRRSLSQKVLVSSTFATLGLIIAGLNQTIIGISVFLVGLSLAWHMGYKKRNAPSPPEEEPVESQMMRTCAGKEVTLSLMDERKATGKAAAADDPQNIDGYILLYDGKMIEEDDDDDTITESSDVTERIYIQVEMICTIMLISMDKIAND